MAHPVILRCVEAGFLEPCRIFDGDGRELFGFRPTEQGRKYFGTELVERTIPLNVVDLKDFRKGQAS